MGLGVLSFASTAAAAITVNTTSDSASGACSLRVAILAVTSNTTGGDCSRASGDNTITLPAGHYTLTAGELQVGASANLAIVGTDQNDPTQTEIDAGAASRVLEVTAGGQATLTGVEITGGQSASGANAASPGQSAGSGEDGGGILNKGTLTLQHALVTANFTGHGGRGVDGDQPSASYTRNGQSGGSGGNGGGIYNATGASLTVSASTIKGNGTGDGGSGGNGAAGQLGIGKFPYGSDGGTAGPPGSGGGIYNFGGATITDTTIESNFSGRGGNGGLGGQGVGEGDMQPAGRGGYGGNGGNSGLTYSPDTGNPQYTAYYGGGGIFNAGTLQMSRSTIVGNNTGAGGNGGGAGIGGQKLSNGFQTGAHAGAAGGGGLGGGLLNYGKGATLTNVTVTENLTGDGGKGGNGPQSGSLGPGPGGFGGYGGGVWAEGAHSPDSLALAQVTIAGNTVGAAGPPGDDATYPGASGQRGKGAGVAVGSRYDPGSGAGVYFRNTLVANNGSAPAGDVNCVQYYSPAQYVDLYDLGHNLSYPDATCPGANGNPLLGALQNNGGPTQTMMPGAGSAVIGAVPPASCTVSEDQRGFPRSAGGPTCDIGAVETGLTPASTSTETAVSSSANPSTAGQQVSFTATVSPTPDGGSVSFTDGGAAIPGCGSVALSGGGQASCPVTYTAAGSHAIVASYLGDSGFAPSGSDALSQVVQAPQGGGGGSSPSPSPHKAKPVHCPKSKKRVIRHGKVKCVPKHKHGHKPKHH